MSNKPQIIIIKKVKKGHGGHHGGAWKVAYADFVTAMMAFFLLMWLLNMSSPEQRVRLAYYYKNFSIFEKSGAVAIGATGETVSLSGQGQEQLNSPSDKSKPSSMSKVTDMTTQEKIEQDLKYAITEQLGEDAGEQVLIDRVEGGLRIQVVDRDGRAMFELGSANPRPLAKKIVKVIAKSIAGLPNKIMIEGHTDSYGFKNNGQYTNWDLSSDRANATRKLLVKGGVSAKRIARVAGYADTNRLVPDVPMDPRNRRISIILLDEAQDKHNDMKMLIHSQPERLEPAK